MFDMSRTTVVDVNIANRIQTHIQRNTLFNLINYYNLKIVLHIILEYKYIITNLHDNCV